RLEDEALQRQRAPHGFRRDRRFPRGRRLTSGLEGRTLRHHGQGLYCATDSQMSSEFEKAERCEYLRSGAGDEPGATAMSYFVSGRASASRNAAGIAARTSVAIMPVSPSWSRARSPARPWTQAPSRAASYGGKPR